MLCCLNGNNKLGAKHFSRTRHGYKEMSVCIEVARAVCYNSFYFVNNKSDLHNVSESDFFCFVVNFSIVHTLFELVTF